MLRNENVMKDITPELKLDWKRWMGGERARDEGEYASGSPDSTIDDGSIDTSSDMHRQDGDL